MPIKKTYRTGKKIRNYFKRSVKKRIFSEGFIAGILAGIAIRTGIDIDKGGFILKIAEFSCKNTNNNFDCSSLVATLSLIILVFTTIALWLEIRRVKNKRIFGINLKGWQIGILIYFLSLLLGLIIVLLL